MKGGKITLRLAATSFAFMFLLRVHAQLEIRYIDDYRAAGVFNVATKKWLVAPAYNQLVKVPYAGSKENFTAFEARKGARWLLLDGKGKPIPGAVFDSLEYSGVGRTFLVKNMGSYAVYEFGKGINADIGWFDSYRSDRYYVSGHVIWIIRRGEKFALLNMHHPGKPAWNLDEIYAYGYPYTTGRYLLWARLNGSYGIIDTSGAFVIPPGYERLRLPERSTYSNLVVRHFAARKDGKWGLVNIEGQVTAPFVFDSILTELYTSRDPEDTYPVMPALRNGKWGIIDTSGNCALPCEYDSVPRITAHKRIIALRNGKTGVTDFSGATLFPFLYRHAELISEYYLHAASFDNFLFSHDAPANAKDTAGLWGLADHTGKVIRPPKAKLLRLFRDYNDTKDARLSAADDVRFVGWLWNEGGVKRKTVVHTDSIFVEDTGAGHMEATDYYGYHFAGGKTGVIDREGNALVQVKYDELLLPCLTRAKGVNSLGYRSSHKPSVDLREECWTGLKYPPLGRLGSKWGILSWGGKELTPFAFDSITPEPTMLAQYEDMNDSVMAAGSLSGLVFRVYKNGLFGYYSVRGEELLAPVHKFTKIAVAYLSKRGMILLDAGRTTQKGLFLAVVRKDFTIDGYEARIITYEPDPYTYVDQELVSYQPMLITQGGSLNLFNPISGTLLLKEWAEDIILKSSEDSARPVSFIRWSDAVSQVRARNPGSDTIRPAAKAAGTGQVEAFDAGDFDNTFFYKHRGLWYIFDAGTGQAVPDQPGFDSVLIETVWFTGYKKGKFEKFSYSHNGPFPVHLDVEVAPFPNDPGLRLVARNCELTYVNVPYKRRQSLFDESTGSYLRDTLIDDVAIVPLIKKGQFNIYSRDRRPALKEWADEIIFPVKNWEERFSLQDTASVCYRPGWISEGRNLMVSEDYKKSMALRYGKKWKLVGLTQPGRYVEDLDSVRVSDGVWTVVKNGRVLYYWVDGVSAAEGK